MDKKITAQLEEARALFYAWKLPEAYRIFRRYFDRMPFGLEEGHVEYLPIFVRLLLETGKDFELKFYLTELEKVCAKTKSPGAQYALGAVYSYGDRRKLEESKKIFEDILRNPNAREFHPKAKMFLARYYEVKGDVAAIRYLIDSIGEVEDEKLKHSLIGWKAYAARLEKRYAVCHEILDDLLAQITPESDWIAYTFAVLTRAMAFVSEGRWKDARRTSLQLRRLVEGKNFRMVQRQLEELNKLIEEKASLGVINCMKEDGTVYLEYSGTKIALDGSAQVHKLILHLLRKRDLDKKSIIQVLYGREYGGKNDDALVYYQMHTLRKWFRSKGFPENSIKSCDKGYTLVPKVEFGGEKNES